MRKMWSFLLAALALTGCAAAPADALPAAETAEMTTGAGTPATPIMRLHGWMMKMTRKACTPCC